MLFYQEHGFTDDQKVLQMLQYPTKKVFEDSMLDWLKALRRYHLDPVTCFAGGSYLNIATNTLIQQSGLFDSIHIPPFTDDSGIHFGAAIWGCFEENETIKLPDNLALLGKKI